MGEIDPVPDPAVPPATAGVVLHRAALVYDLVQPFLTLLQERALSLRTVALLGVQPSDKVLDLGCATGSMSFAVAGHLDRRRGGLCVGIDASPEMIARARRKILSRPCRFDIGLAERLPYRDGVFDKAVSTYFFHHLALPEKLAALREVRRVLKPGGVFVVVDVDTPTTALARFCARLGQRLLRQPELGENIEGKLVPLFAEAGFRDPRRLAHDFGCLSTFRMHR